MYLYSSYKEDRYDDVLLGADEAEVANELTYGAGLGAAAAGVAHELAYEYAAGAGGGAATALYEKIMPLRLSK
jgi:hypothetical protein